MTFGARDRPRGPAGVTSPLVPLARSRPVQDVPQIHGIQDILPGSAVLGSAQSTEGGGSSPEMTRAAASPTRPGNQLRTSPPSLSQVSSRP